MHVDEQAGPAPANKTEVYARLTAETRALLEGERDTIANLANAAALIWEMVPRLNWAGFYLWKDDELVLGPFQGRAACVRIALGRGVCGRAAERRSAVVVPDVLQFPGHIACDAASRSEIVVPLVIATNEKEGRLVGVLDLDSAEVGRFDEEDRAGLEAFARVVIEATDFE